MLHLDGSQGEGGGQVLRTSLALSLITQTPFRIDDIRAGRKRPGLRRQHLTALEAATAVGRAEVEGAAVDSRSVTFRPRGVHPGDYRFDVGTAGSVTLVLQTVLPALITAGGSSSLVLQGGTHNPLAPPFDFLERVYLPLLGRMGPRVSATLDRPGFYPAGGGKFRVQIEPAAKLAPLWLTERGDERAVRAKALVSQLPASVGERELRVVRRELGWKDCQVVEVKKPRGPGNALLLELEHEHVTEMVCAFGEKGVRAEDVAQGAVAEVRAYQRHGAPVGEHLADQLLLLLCLAGSGALRTGPLSLHATTQIALIPRFLDVRVAARQESEHVVHLEVTR
jgi:RNA 3'-terminal phosphate cyclase (ATP)